MGDEPETTKPDVLEVMRAFGARDCDYFPSDEWVAEAADEIERLRRVLNAAENYLCCQTAARMGELIEAVYAGRGTANVES